jgi:1,4-dihydroxy-2-naphthoate octaprenyltransferase
MFKSLLRLSRPVFLLLAAMTYILGAGIAHYIGQTVRVASFGLGVLSVLSLLIAAFFLAEYFRLPLVPLMQGETFSKREHYRVVLLQVSYAAITLTIVAIFTLQINHLLSIPSAILFILAFLSMIAYAIPPMRLSESGYGELVLAVTLGTILPAVAFLLQAGQLFRLLSITTFPLTLLALAYLLINNFPTFANDQKFGRHTLLTRLTWQNAIPIHHFLVLAAFLILSTAPFLGYPWSLVWPVFLALPFAAIQIIWLQRIGNGGRTLWNFLTALASGTFGLTVYLLALTFWIR